MKDFSAHRGRDHAALTDRIPQILDAAFTRAGNGDLWADRKRFPRSDGDGYVAGFPPAELPFLLNPFLHALQAELESQNRADLVVPGRPIRMRVSINVGPVTDSGADTISDGSGTARVETHRLLDAPAVKSVLERSGPQTYVAAIVSARAYEDAVMTGYAGLDESYFARVDVQVKAYRGVAFLRVPNPTGELLRTGLWPETGEASAGGSDVSSGSAARTIGTVIGTSHGPVHSGTGDQYNGPPSVYRKGRRDRS
jgi:hypothetical protein